MDHRLGIPLPCCDVVRCVDTGHKAGLMPGERCHSMCGARRPDNGHMEFGHSANMSKAAFDYFHPIPTL
eukprot:COSAG02_NODE_3986_length_5948_cov_1.918619_3_plen_69_part_00